MNVLNKIYRKSVILVTSNAKDIQLQKSIGYHLQFKKK